MGKRKHNVQKSTKMAYKFLEKRISAAMEELKTVTKQRDYRATNQNIYSFMRLLNQNSLNIMQRSRQDQLTGQFLCPPFYVVLFLVTICFISFVPKI